MSIGTGVVLFVIGAILAFAVDIDLGGVVNLSLIGYILMIAGAITFIVGLVLTLRRRQSVATTRSAVDPASGERVTRTTNDSDPIV